MLRLTQLLPMLAAVVVAGSPAAPADRPMGYLAPGEFDVIHVLEPAPRRGDPRYATDRKIFRATRKLIGTPRWRLATADVDTSVSALLRDFSCAVGAVMTPQNTPKLVTLVQRAGADTSTQTGAAKDFYRRDRPYVIDRGPICQRPAELFDQQHQRVSYDYPSGHTTWGWTWALILAGLAPDRAPQIMERGRAYGDSRFVCGVHNESAVEAGFLSASATMAVVQTKLEYQADRADAQAELSAIRASGTRPSGCEAEAALLREPVMPSRDKH